jgi:hypothetical protein
MIGKSVESLSSCFQTQKKAKTSVKDVENGMFVCTYTNTLD